MNTIDVSSGSSHVFTLCSGEVLTMADIDENNLEEVEQEDDDDDDEQVRDFSGVLSLISSE